MIKQVFGRKNNKRAKTG